MKRIVCVAMLAMVQACGGGGGGGGNNPAPGSGGSSGGGTSADPLSIYIDVNKLYSGNRAAAPLTVSSMDRFLQLLYVAAPNMAPGYKDPNLVSDQTCVTGQAVTSKTADPNVLTVDLTDCFDGTITATGQLTLRAVAFNELGEPTIISSIYKDVQLKTPVGNFVARGTISEASNKSTCIDVTQTYDLLLKSESKQIYFANFRARRGGFQSSSCSAGNGGQINGTIYDSDLGYVSYQSDGIFRQSSLYPGNYQGSYRLLGANNTSVKLSVDKGLGPNSAIPYIQLELDHTGDAAVDQRWLYVDGDTMGQLITDHSDADRDGMQDSWERFYGLSPTDPNDAFADADADGYSNLDEYLYYGDPNSSWVYPMIADIQVVGQNSTVKYTGKYQANFQLRNLSRKVTARGFNVTVTASGDGHLAAEAGCTRSEQNKKMTCAYSGAVSPQSSSALYFALEPDKVDMDLKNTSVRVAVTMQTADPDLSNNNAESIAVRNSPDIRARISSIKNNLDFEGFSNALTVTQQYELSVDNIGADEVTKNLLKLTATSQVEISALSQLVAGRYEPRDPAEPIYLDLGRTIRFSLTAVQSGIGSFSLDLSNPTYPQLVSQHWQMPVIVGNSSSVIQQAVDAAPSGATVEIDPGIYVGAVDLKAKPVHVRSKAGPDQTILVPQTKYSPHNLWTIADNSSLQGFTFLHWLQARGQNIEFSDNKLSHPNIQYGAYLDIAGSARIERNVSVQTTLPKAEAWFTLGSACPLMYLAPNDQFIGSMVVQNNVLIAAERASPKDACGYAVFAYSLNNITIRHNTIVNYQKPIVVTNNANLPDMWMSYDVRYNLIDNADTPIQIGIGYLPLKKAELSNNLVWRNAQPISSEPAVPSGENLSADPQLDPSGKPMQGSPAIDSAVGSDLSVDAWQQQRPKDGNGDGNAVSDIGAVEF